MRATPSERRRAVCFTAYTDNLRAKAIVDGLIGAGWDVIASRGRGPRSTPLELVMTLLPNCWMAIRTHADVAVGCKPHLNVTAPLLLCKMRGIPTWLDIDDRDHAYRTGVAARLLWSTQHPFPRHFDVLSYHNPMLRNHLIADFKCDPRRIIPIPQGVNPSRFESTRGAACVAGPRVASLRRTFEPRGRPRCGPQGLAPSRRSTPDGSTHGNRRRSTSPSLPPPGRSTWPRSERRFSGAVNRSEVPAYLAIADLALLYASDRLVNRYRCSLKLREYFAAGLPVVCNEFGELADFKDVTYQSNSSIEGFAAMAVRVLDGYNDGRQDRARDLARRDMDWRLILRTAECEIVRRLCDGSASSGTRAPHSRLGQAQTGPGTTTTAEGEVQEPQPVMISSPSTISNSVTTRVKN